MTGLQERYERTWGPAVDTVTFTKDSDPFKEFQVMAFLPHDSRVGRVATHGLSSCIASDGVRVGIELLFALSAEYLRANWGKVRDFAADMAAHLVSHAFRPSPGSTVGNTSLAPWPPNALIFDVPRGEPEEFEHFEWDGEHCHLVWAIPAYAEEAEFVRTQGIVAFDALVDANDYSLADVFRPSALKA